MEIIDISDYKEIRFNTAIALGNFDGIHLGHQQLIKTMVNKSKELGLKSSLLLFKNHTKTILNIKTPGIITSNQQKIQIAEDLGIDIIYMLAFDENVMKLSGEDFVKNIIINKMNGKLLVVGFDYRFGHKASGNADYLKELGEKHSIEVIVLDAIIRKETVLSSTQVRVLIENGNMEEVTAILGRPFALTGNVIHGANRGNKLGFPTANLKLEENYVIPKTGVYMTNTILNGKCYLSATNIGYNPTFEGNKLKIETYIIDFNESIYDQDLKIEFIEYLREDIKFDNKEELIIQMKNDIETIKSRH